jgi:hypothetical protein
LRKDFGRSVLAPMHGREERDDLAAIPFHHPSCSADVIPPIEPRSDGPFREAQGRLSRGRHVRSRSTSPPIDPGTDWQCRLGHFSGPASAEYEIVGRRVRRAGCPVAAARPTRKEERRRLEALGSWAERGLGA